MALAWNKTRFVKSCVKPQDYPKFGHHTKLVAICGRSNVGKSTLINELCQQKSLAKTSATPGKTQLINFFTIEDRLVLVDLPGYGYAKVPQAMKAEWGKTVSTFLNEAKQLEIVLFLLDIRRIPSGEDLEFLEWLAATQKPFLLVLTKADKLSQAEAKKQVTTILEHLPYSGMEYVVHSSKSGLGTHDLRQKVEDYGTH